MNDRLEGWRAIADYLHVGVRTAQRYERDRGLPIHRLPGANAPVFAFRAGLDAWRTGGKVTSRVHEENIAPRILERIAELSRGSSLYRRDFTVRFALRPNGLGVEGHVAVEYELVNASNERQPYTQEVTIDECERGRFEQMSVSADGKPITVMARNYAGEQRRGHIAYRGRTLLIEPISSGKRYTGKQEWYVSRRDHDYWYLHVGIVTFGVSVETSAPPDFEITPSYSSPDSLLTIGQHIDVTWKRKPRNA